MTQPLVKVTQADNLYKITKYIASKELAIFI